MRQPSAVLALLATLATTALAGEKPKDTAKVTTGQVSVEGGKIAYDVRGSGPAVLLIHGGFGDRRMWDGQLAALADRYKVIRMDLRGFGRSPAASGPYVSAEDLTSLLNGLKIERVHLVGNSMGGTLALDYALAVPSRVSSLTLVSASPDGYVIPEADRDRVRDIFNAAEERGLPATAELWLKHPMVAVTSKDARSAELLRRMVMDNRRMFLTHFWAQTVEPPALNRLGEVKVPTLIVVGDKDMASVQGASDVLAAGIKGAQKHVITGADHLPQMTHAEQFNGVLRAFLTSAR